MKRVQPWRPARRPVRRREPARPTYKPRLRHDVPVPADRTFARLIAETELGRTIRQITDQERGILFEREAWAHLASYLSAKAFALAFAEPEDRRETKSERSRR